MGIDVVPVCGFVERTDCVYGRCERCPQDPEAAREAAKAADVRLRVHLEKGFMRDAFECSLLLGRGFLVGGALLVVDLDGARAARSPENRGV